MVWRKSLPQLVRQVLLDCISFQQGMQKETESEENFPGAQNPAKLLTGKFQKEGKEHLAASDLHFLFP